MSYNAPTYGYTSRSDSRPPESVPEYFPASSTPYLNQAPGYDTDKYAYHRGGGHNDPSMYTPVGRVNDIPYGASLQGAAQYLTDPVVANAAMHYGSQIMGSGKNIVDKELGKYVALSKFKYYFAVDTQYVLQKLKLLLFPFTNKDWSLKYDQNEPMQPRYDTNAPDLYIPMISYVTYVLVAGLVLGMQNRFSPEVLGIISSQALAWTLVEIVVQLVTLYVINIESNLKTLDLLAFSGYKFVGIIIAVLLSIVGGKKGYFMGLFYTSLALCFFLVRSLKFQVLTERNPTNLDGGYSSPTQSAFSSGNKRRMYFMLFMAASQPLLMWWLSFHLISFSN